jgi:signal transduction histidine kinase
LLAFARRQPLDPRPTDVNALIRGMTGLVRRTLDSRIELRAELAPGLWPTLIDRGQLEAALMNLIVNARDAMPEGGLLTIETRNAVIGPAQVAEMPQDGPQADDIAAGEYVVVAVGDTGKGMPAELIEHIFEPFFTTKGPGKARVSGSAWSMGSSSSRGGHVHVDSALGRGTQVALYLPKSDLEQAAMANGPRITERGAQRPEDDADTGEIEDARNDRRV